MYLTTYMEPTIIRLCYWYFSRIDQNITRSIVIVKQQYSTVVQLNSATQYVVDQASPVLTRVPNRDLSKSGPMSE